MSVSALSRGETETMTLRDLSELPAPVAANKVAVEILKTFGEKNRRLRTVVELAVMTVELCAVSCYAAQKYLDFKPPVAVDTAEA